MIEILLKCVLPSVPCCHAAIFQHGANWIATSETNLCSYHLTGKLKVLKIQCIPWVSRQAASNIIVAVFLSRF